jgi:hypothetical protein
MDHHTLAAECFNATWDLLEKESRTSEETDRMLDLAHASRWHWTQTEECTPRNLAVGAWQLSRVCAVTGYLDEAFHHAEVSLAISKDNDLSPFYQGFAYEALARSAPTADRDVYLAAAKELASHVDDEHDRAALLADLAEVESTLSVPASEATYNREPVTDNR